MSPMMCADETTSGTGVIINVWWDEKGEETEQTVKGQSVEKLGWEGM